MQPKTDFFFKLWIFNFTFCFKLALVQFVVNLNLNKKTNCEEVLIVNNVDANDDSEFIYVDELTKVENAMIDADVTDDLKMRLLSILFAFDSTANQIKRASALVSSSILFGIHHILTITWNVEIVQRSQISHISTSKSLNTNFLSLQPWSWF